MEDGARFRVKGSSDSYESHFSLKDLFEFLTRFRGGVAPAGNSRTILLIWKIMHVFATVVHLTLTNPIVL